MTFRNLTTCGSRLLWGLSLVWGVACGGPAEPDSSQEVLRAETVTTTQQALSPIQDPQLCSLPTGRYVVSAAMTDQTEVYNVTFHNDGLETSPISANCKTMKFVWDIGIPYPATPPRHLNPSEFPRALLEGWWDNSASPKRFAVKADWFTKDNLGVITQIAGVSARGYFVAPEDLGIPQAWRFNWTGSGSTASHTKYFYPFSLYPSLNDWANLFITDQSNAAYQSLYCESGTTRLFEGNQFNCPLSAP